MGMADPYKTYCVYRTWLALSLRTEGVEQWKSRNVEAILRNTLEEKRERRETNRERERVDFVFSVY